METHFSDQYWIYGVFLKFRIFSAYFLNFGWKGDAPGDTWHARRVPGVVSRCGLSGWRTRRAPGRGSRGTSHSEIARVGLSGLGHAGHVAGSGASGDSPGRGTRGQVSCSEDSRIWLTGWTLGDRCRVRRLPGQLSLAGLAAHSGASGRVSWQWVLGR